MSAGAHNHAHEHHGKRTSRGQRLYGRYPILALEGPDDTDFGRWIPSTAVDEYASTLARWFGVPATDLPLVFPNIGRFATPNLGFLP